MTVRAIVRFPSPLLRARAAPVTVFNAALAELVADLLDTMHAAPGIGITAPHIGIPSRVVVIELSETDKARTYVNPVIIWHSSGTVSHAEGSVSMPGVTEEIERPGKVRVAYQDLAGISHTVEADGLLAVCLQHEIDQLDGVFWINRLSRLKRDRVVKRFEKILRAREEA